MSRLCARATARSTRLELSAPHPALARSALTRRSTAASVLVMPPVAAGGGAGFGAGFGAGLGLCFGLGAEACRRTGAVTGRCVADGRALGRGRFEVVAGAERFAVVAGFGGEPEGVVVTAAGAAAASVPAACAEPGSAGPLALALHAATSAATAPSTTAARTARRPRTPPGALTGSSGSCSEVPLARITGHSRRYRARGRGPRREPILRVAAPPPSTRATPFEAALTCS